MGVERHVLIMCYYSQSNSEKKLARIKLKENQNFASWQDVTILQEERMEKS